MGFLDRLLGKREREVPSHQLPSDVVCQEFGEVNVRKTPDATEVLFTILMEPTGVEAEGWQTGVALDGSGSMQGAFGKDIAPGSGGEPPKNLLRDYARKGWLKVFEHQGQQIPIFSEEAKADLVSKGYFVWSKNEVEPLARQMTSYLASQLDADGGTTVIYWACGDGTEVEVVGDLTGADCETASFEGPREHRFGTGTSLTPAVRYFVDRFEDAKRGMYIFVTDGRLDDQPEVKRYTKRLARAIAGGKRNPVKCVLIGVGSEEEIDEGQMEELDDLETGTDVDIWDHKIAREMRALIEIFAEVVGEHQIVAPTATIYDDAGNVAARFADGLPAKVSFRMSPSSDAFELEVAGRRLRQTLVSRKSR